MLSDTRLGGGPWRGHTDARHLKAVRPQLMAMIGEVYDDKPWVAPAGELGELCKRAIDPLHFTGNTRSHKYEVLMEMLRLAGRLERAEWKDAKREVKILRRMRFVSMLRTLPDDTLVALVNAQADIERAVQGE